MHDVGWYVHVVEDMLVGEGVLGNVLLVCTHTCACVCVCCWCMCWGVSCAQDSGHVHVHVCVHMGMCGLILLMHVPMYVIVHPHQDWAWEGAEACWRTHISMTAHMHLRVCGCVCV